VRLRKVLEAYAYLAPNFLGFVVFTALPVVAVAVMAFYEGSFATHDTPSGVSVDARFCGLDNFRTVVSDPDLLRATRNTFILLAAVPLQMAASLGLAMLLNRKIKGRVFWRTLLFLPSIASGIALFLVWRWIFNADFGLLNAVVGGRTDWLGRTDLAKPALIGMGVWTAMGGANMVLYLAGLQGIDPTLYEAAEIDGAGPWSQFVHVTWPELRPTTFFILTTNLIAGFQIFDQVYIMTGGGPEGATTTILYLIYTNMYVFEGKLGYAAAISIYLFAIVFVFTLVSYFTSRGGARAVRS
jgi:multiple sugar transport system permease protein